MDAQEVGFKCGSQSCHLALDKGDGAPPPPLGACILKSPHLTIYTLRGLLQRFLWKQLHTKAGSHCWWRREDGDAPGGTLVTWVMGHGQGAQHPSTMTGYPITPRGGTCLLQRGKWRAAAIGSSFLSVGLTTVWAM